MGHQIKVETQGSVGTKTPLSEHDIAEADVVIFATDIRVDATRFAGKPIYETRTSEAIRHPKEVIEAALALLPAEAAPVKAMAGPVELPIAPASAVSGPAGKRLVGITACPTLA
jgi:fructose PTS system EIIBC or EIIC component